MVALKGLTCPLAYGCYSVVATILTPSSWQIGEKNLEVIWSPLGVNTAKSIVNLATDCSMKTMAILVVFAHAVWICLVSSD